MTKPKMALIALFCVFLLVGTVTYLSVPVEAIIPLIVVGVVIGLSAFVAGWFVMDALTTQMTNPYAGYQYVEHTGLNFQNLMTATMQEYANEAELIPRACYYWMRRAESTSQYYINETTFPYAKVFTNSGLENEYFNLLNGTKANLEAVNNVAEGFAETTFQQDLSIYDINAYYLSLQAHTSLKQNDLTVLYGIPNHWTTYPVANALNWTFTGDATIHDYIIDEGSGIFTGTSTDFVLNNATTVTFSGTVWGNKATQNVILELRNATDDTLIDSDTQNLGFIGTKTFAFAVTNPEQGLVYLILKTTSHENGDMHIQTSGIVTDTFPVADDANPFIPVLTYNNQIIGRYAFNNATATPTGTIAEIDLVPLYNQESQYVNAVKAQLFSAMQNGIAYWQYLKALGYDDYTDIPTLIPTPDLLMPPTDSTFWSSTEIGTAEREAMLAAYMQSLYDLFQNETVARNIQNVTFTDISFTNLPVWCTGTIHFNQTDTTTANCSSIWLQPLTSSLTLTKNSTVRMGQSVQAVYQDAETGKITYAMLNENDAVNIERLYTRDKYGTVTERQSVAISITDLNRYSYNYVTGYDPLDLSTTPSFEWTNLLVTMMIVVVMVSMISSFSKGGRGRR
ncbi:MAG: hypothetical protein NWF01_08790 [Candidatus Bathyarchaeota archaeon]|nr:hypothetical protein [Candidatus Bathyarchaeota archaeon]